MPQELSFLQVDPADLQLPVEASVNPQMGAATTSVQIPLSAGRNGFQPQLSLGYSSGSGNSVFGMGWALQGLPVLGLSLKDGYPKYDGTDKFAFNGQELVPWLETKGDGWNQRTDETSAFYINYYRAVNDTFFTRFEKWVDKSDQKVHWRVHSTDNQVMLFGANTDDSTKVFDKENPTNIFQWLLEAQYDNWGNSIRYEYKAEDLINVEGSPSFERNRVLKRGFNAQRYLKRIHYGNQIPEYPNQVAYSSQKWLFEVVFDYGDQERDNLPYHNTFDTIWHARPDAFSSYIAGFEQRTYRLCQRILMYHHFEELGTGSTLVGNMQLNHDERAEGSVLKAIGYTGYKRTMSDTYDSKSFPQTIFDYTIPEVASSFESTTEQSNSNIPIGLNGLNYKWTDLYGEGLPGILYESNTAWYYKPNLGNGNLGQQQLVMQKPSSNFGGYALSDFDGDGNLNVVVLQGRESGYFEYNRDKEIWNGFTPFMKAPSIRQLDVNTQLIDLTGDGRSDIVTTEADRTIWYPSEGKEGFGHPIQISKPISNGVSQAPALGANPILDYFFADMNGSGLPDQVHIYNGKVEYWPNMGNGKFGAGIVMENAPQLDFDFELDASRIRLVDLDGSGTSDLVYLGRGEITYWINASGNQFLEGVTLKGLPFIDNISSAQIIDLLGDGTPCLVWSSALVVHSDAPIHYLKLTNGIKPRLLKSIKNNMGLETQFHYGYSGSHYLRDKSSDTPWMTKLPSHPIVVDRLEVIDYIGNTRFNQVFEYHDGFFDGEERTFRGFCLVDQYDSEKYQGTSTMPETNFSDPVCLRTWYHNGAAGWSDERALGYYKDDTFSPQLSEYGFEDNDLGPNEFFDALRALAGQTLRTETYGLTRDGTRKTHPFQIIHSNFTLRKLQPKRKENDASFAVFQRESLVINFEESPDDPHITHSFNLKIDGYGVSLLQSSIAYPRLHADAKPEQQVTHWNTTKNHVIHFDTPDRYEISIPIENKSFKVHDDTPSIGRLYSFSEVQHIINEALVPPIAFNETFTQDKQAKLLQWNQNFYWNEAQTDVLPLGEVGTKVLVHHQEAACFNSSFLEEAMGIHYNPNLANEGGYLFRNAYWWQLSNINQFSQEDRFYLPTREVMPSGAYTSYEYDSYQLTLVASNTVLVDETGSELARTRTSATIDYHVVAPFQITDANQNTSEVFYDSFGVVLRSSLWGELLSSNGNMERQGHGRLTDYVEPTTIEFDDILNSPLAYIQECSTFFYYELDTWENEKAPLRSIALAREQWVNDGEGNYTPESRIQVSVNYKDGFARTTQSKTLVEGGPDTLQYVGDSIVLGTDGEPEFATSDELRWQVSGHLVYNNKQEAVQQYEPYFSPKVGFENDEVLATFGQSTRMEYDALGRQKQIHLPDGTFTKAEFHPWYIKQYDANDTINDSPYNLINESLLASDSPEGIALEKSKIYYDTPVISYTDGLGRVFQVEESDENGRVRSNKTSYDSYGNPQQLIDARNLVAFSYLYDMQGRLFHEVGMDAGEKWQFSDALNQTLHLWDARKVHQQLFYDTWGRITHKKVDGALDMNHITERFIYAEDSSVTDPWQKNLAGQLVAHYDQAGVHRIHRLDVLGNVLEKDRCLVKDYKTIPDWSDLDQNEWMDGEAFTTKVSYDALGRFTTQELPDETIRETTYLQSGALDQLLLTTGDGDWVQQPIVEKQQYNARGQLQESILGNGVVQQYEYDSYNYRLQQKRSFRRASGSVTGKYYQNIQYTYDAVGNITYLSDSAQPNTNSLFNQPRVNRYTYDAFYQLIEAQGRTHQAMQRTDYAHGLDAPGFIKGTRHINLNNLDQLQSYTRTYEYDLNGNMEHMVHRSGANASSVLRWRRDFWISATSNRSLENKDLNGNILPRPEERFDENGNLTYLSHLHAVHWNYLSQLSQAVVIERANGENDEEYYSYGGDGQRLRKVSQRWANGSLEVTEKIYLKGCEIKRITQGNTLQLERYTSHLGDGNERVAFLHRWTRDKRSLESDDITNKKIHYQLNCHLGSSALELNDQGDIISYEEYFAFGGSAFIYGDALRDIQLKEYRYSGKERDDVTGFYYYGFRYYAPWLCRWLNPDPIGPKDGLNVYQFVHNNPVNSIDPDGLQTSSGVNVPYPRQFNSRNQEENLRIYLLTHKGIEMGSAVWNPSYEQTHTDGEQEWTQHGRWEFQGRLAPIDAGILSGLTRPPQINRDASDTIPVGSLFGSGETNTSPSNGNIGDDPLAGLDDVLSSDDPLAGLDEDIVGTGGEGETSGGGAGDSQGTGEGNSGQQSVSGQGNGTGEGSGQGTGDGTGTTETSNTITEELNTTPTNTNTTRNKSTGSTSWRDNLSTGQRFALWIDEGLGTDNIQTAANFFSGMGSALTFDITGHINRLFGNDQHLNPESTATRMGGYFGDAVIAVATGGTGSVRAAAGIVVRDQLQNQAMEQLGVNELIGQGIGAASEAAGIDPSVAGTVVGLGMAARGRRGNNGPASNQAIADSIGTRITPRRSAAGVVDAPSSRLIPDPPGTRRDAAGRLRNERGRFAEDPNATGRSRTRSAAQRASDNLRANFRRHVGRILRDNPNHPLRHLVDEEGNFHTRADRVDDPDTPTLGDYEGRNISHVWEAGHRTTDALRRSGDNGIVEELGVQSRYHNQSDSHIGEGTNHYVENVFYDVEGIPVEARTLNDFLDRGRFSQELRRKLESGEITQAVFDELGGGEMIGITQEVYDAAILAGPVRGWR